jgi:type II secretory pathway predicted ATPase ExeA/septal ring-binding cell division protein DamX
MYLEHFGLRESPFRITPHTEFFFAGANRGATLEALIYAITHDEGIVKVSGEVGSGKTMLCRMLLEKLPGQVETVYLANPSLSRDEILYAIAEELGAPLPDGRAHMLLRNLQDRLLEIYAAGRQVVVLIDEAHAMPPETLEEIRLLSNLESNRHKLLQIVLFGQPELDERLSDMNMRQLKERITHNFALEPLRRSDVPAYLMFRIRAAGYHGPDLFTTGAIQLISQASEGLTRRINILADKALLSAFSEGSHQIDNKQVKAAIRDAQFKPMRDSSAKPWVWIGAAAAIAAVAGTAYLAGSHNSTNRPGTPPTAAPTAASAAAPVAATTTAPTAMPEPAAVAAVSQPATTTTASAPTSTTVAATSAQVQATEKPVPLAERIAATDEWLKKTPGSHYFIQLLNTDASNQRNVEFFLENNTKSLDPQQLRVYRSNLSGRDKLGVIYGDYPSREAANAALAKLPEPIRASRHYIRTTSKLR